MAMRPFTSLSLSRANSCAANGRQTGQCARQRRGGASVRVSLEQVRGSEIGPVASAPMQVFLTASMKMSLVTFMLNKVFVACISSTARRAKGGSVVGGQWGALSAFTAAELHAHEAFGGHSFRRGELSGWLQARSDGERGQWKRYGVVGRKV